MVGILLLLAVLLGLALAFMASSFLFAKKQPKNIPPGSMGWPLLGETLGYLKPHQSNSIGTFLQDHCSRYGKVFKSHLFCCPTIVSCDYELNMFILQNEEKLFQCSYPKAIHGILGQLSLLVVVGDVHKKLRSFAVSFASTCKGRPDYFHNIEKLAILTMEPWKTRKEIIFCHEAKKFTFNLILKQILSMDLDDPLASKILEDFTFFMEGLISLPLNLPGSRYAKALKARERISTTVRSIIEEREKRGADHKKGDFLDVLLSNEGLSYEGKSSILVDLLLGGYETTSILMSMVVYFLGTSPHALDKLKEEHQAIRASKKEKLLNGDDYKKMEFTQNVISEALRCGNVVKFLHRKALQDVNFKGYFIPSGWKVLPVLTAVNLDPSLHSNASEFNPWRWNGQSMTKNMIPFGGGPRLCPGLELAKVETSFFLHHLVLKYRWSAKEIDHPLAHPYVEFKSGLPLEIEPLKMNERRQAL
ncbi:hypothetical protein AQUCO_01100417v1 [Aquilegia coerulea]|uniref:Cytochrome P450 724B1 n=1 Tax=Aquilegia coerulea TaxID=218851 RepID=A0A2G5E729_AQUCA|nr:hypothetical protein AQUCO_01100417v1 [Aquilegia coerulea]